MIIHLDSYFLYLEVLHMETLTYSCKISRFSIETTYNGGQSVFISQTINVFWLVKIC